MANNPNNVRLEDEVFKLQNLIVSASNALEIFETNAQHALSQENLVNILHLAMDNDQFRKAFVNAIVSQIGSTRMIREVGSSYKDDIKEAIYARVQSLLTTEVLSPVVTQILNMVSNGNLPELPDVMDTSRPEDIQPDSVENVSKILQLLAGDKAWKS
jgi:hypothetical protein